MVKNKNTSRVKITNKYASKKMKTKNKQAALMKRNKTVRNIPKVGKPMGKKGREIDRTKLDYRRSVISTESEVPFEESDFSDEEMKSFLEANSNNMSFLSTSLGSHSAKKRTINNSDVAPFENVPRKSRLYDEDAESSKMKIELLPIKGENGLIKRTAERRNEGHESKSEDEADDIELEEEEVTPMTVIEVLARQREEINQKKLQIAQLSLDIVESPNENIKKLKQLLTLCCKTEHTTIRKLSILSLLEVFKDIIPSYRIRDLTEEEKSVKVSRDVRQLREYEDCLLRSYQKYLQHLDENIKDSMGALKKRRKNTGHSEFSQKNLKLSMELCTNSVSCLADLLRTVPHFNFRNNIINVLVNGMELSHDLSEASNTCFEAIKTALKSDYVGEVALEIVRTIHGLSKSKKSLKPKVLEVLLYLQLDAHLIHETELKGNKIERLKEKREAIKKMSRKERKRKKVEDKLNKELQEVEAVQSQDRIGKKHTEILKFLFVIYFRVLKSEKKTPLLSAVLKGLARFSHLINVDFFGDLMNCLERLLQSDELSTEERLHCILTALKVLSGQGEVLTIDPRQFYSELYNVFLNVTAVSDVECFESIKECLSIMLIKRRKQVSSPQVFGFLKRLSTVLLQLDDEKLNDIFLLIRSIYQLYDKCDYMFDNENFGRGVFRPEIPNPEHSNAESTAVWEFSLLARLYQPDAEIYCKHILNGAPSTGNQSLPVRLIQRQSAIQEDLNQDTVEDIESERITDYFKYIPSDPMSKKNFGRHQYQTSDKLQKLFHRHMEDVENETSKFILESEKVKTF